MTSVEGSASGSVSTEERYKLIRSADVGAAAASVAPATCSTCLSDNGRPILIVSDGHLISWYLMVWYLIWLQENDTFR